MDCVHHIWCPLFSQEFQDLPDGAETTLTDEARSWLSRFTRWYNLEHKHSGIKYVTPDERHRGIDAQILEARKTVYRGAHKRHPERWSKQLRDWELIQAVYLNPEKEAA
ncbi:transposase [Escherichia coli]|nr:transposase [Escherichia coli]